MVLLSSAWISRVPAYSGYPCPPHGFAYGTFTLFGAAFQPSSTTLLGGFPGVLTPHVLLHAVWAPPISLATTLGIVLTFFFTRAAFPHSDICGSTLICSSPQLFAACHVLLRRHVPRHPPYALCSLIFLSSTYPHTLIRISTRLMVRVRPSWLYLQIRFVLTY